MERTSKQRKDDAHILAVVLFTPEALKRYSTTRNANNFPYSDMTILLIIIALLCVVIAYCVGRVVGIAKGFSNAFTMLENYETKKGGIYAKASD